MTPTSIPSSRTTASVARPRTGLKAEMSANLKPRASPASDAPDWEAIRLRAFQIYQARGAVAGHDVEDWEQAQAELARATPLRARA